ncbi:MAG: phospholipid carrier-dependent glycosyltransferase [Clostridiales bacterium]|nr:phospholipid carrier-dependent glycosyltransferase [Clostridiales bacterium]
MKRKVLLVLMALLLILLSACGKKEITYESNLLKNADISETNAYGLPEDFRVVNYIYDNNVTESSIDDGALHIVSYGMNDARFVQSVDVHKNTVYRLSALVKCADVLGNGDYGAGLSIADTFIASQQLLGTGDWQELTLYVNSGDQKQLDVEFRLGFFSNEAMGEVWFKDVSFCAVESVPADAVVYDYESIDDASADEQTPADAQKKYPIMVVIALAAFIAVMMSAYYIEPGNGDIESAGSEKTRTALLILALSAFLIRCITAVFVYGYEVDMGCFNGWSQQVLEFKPWGFYSQDYFCDYPPGYITVLWGIAGIARLFNIDMSSWAYTIMLKLPSIFADILAGVVLYKIAVKKMSPKASLWIACLYIFNPVTIINSAAWGQIDGIMALGILLSVYWMIEQKMFKASIAFALTLLIKPQTLMAGPLLLLAFIHYIRKNGGAGWFMLIKSFFSCAAVCALFSLVYMNDQPWYWLIERYLGTVSSYEYAAVNAMNLFGLFGANWVEQDQAFMGLSYRIWGTLFIVISFGYCAFLQLKRRETRSLPLVGALFFTMVFTFGVRMHERYMFPAFVLLLLAFLYYGDRRLLIAFALLSVPHFMNVSIVLINDYLMEAEKLYTFIFSAVQIAGAMYLMLVSYDICALNKETREFERKENASAYTGGEISFESARMSRKDIIIMLFITLAYAVLAFVNLGITHAPQTEFVSTKDGEYVAFDLGETQFIEKFSFYGGIGNGTFAVEGSNDLENWTRLEYLKDDEITEMTVLYETNTMFEWHEFMPVDANYRFMRVVFGSPGISMFEVGFYGVGNTPIEIAAVGTSGADEERGYDPKLICDEQEELPEHRSYLNSMYFDEIYHARTAYEHVYNMQWYETTHPPLGKALMSLCIMLMGMTPFAWRFAGTLAGVLMLPGMYMTGKLLFKKTKLAAFSTLLMALDCMHYTQTRIATIDSFAVLFIIWMFYFMFRYVLLYDFNKMPLKKTFPPLLLSGIMMGLGIASKWIGAYAGAGLAVVFAVETVRRCLAARRSEDELVRKTWFKKLCLTGAFCVLSFIIIPIAIYMLSYVQYFMIEGGKTLADWWDAQVYMFTYHSGLVDDHYFASPWYEWPLIIRPMWFYKGNYGGYIGTINTMGNPAVWWTGFIAVIALLVLKIRREDQSRASMLLLIGLGAQFLPWVIVPRSTFIYHYFASVPFIIFITCHIFAMLYEKYSERKRWVDIGLFSLIGLSALLFAFFFPAISGIDMTEGYAKLTQWLPTWTMWAP